MVTIRQHGENGKLFDLRAFMTELEPWKRRVDFWMIQIQECTCPNALALMELTSNRPCRLSPLAFWELCLEMHQTIDGEFVAYIAEREIIRLMAVDSSFWEVTEPPEFEEEMLLKYGRYIPWKG